MELGEHRLYGTNVLLTFYKNRYFSHYNEGENAKHGECGCFSSCTWTTSKHCHKNCDDDDIRDDDDDRCHCMRGPLYPNVETC